ncbi:MAG: hypothetical protein WA154_15020 [Moraxellaceae bacterium]
MQNPKMFRRCKTVGCVTLLLVLIGCQPPQSTDSAQPAQTEGSATTAPAENLREDGSAMVIDVADGFDGDMEPTEQVSDQRFAGVSSDVADLLERMESCYSLVADAKSGAMSADEAGDLQSQLGCDEIDSDINRTLQQHADQPKVAQLIQQMKATRR